MNKALSEGTGLLVYFPRETEEGQDNIRSVTALCGTKPELC